MTPPTTYRIVPGEAVDYLPGKTWAYHAACKDWSKMGGPLAYFPGETHYCHSEKRPTHDPTAPATPASSAAKGGDIPRTPTDSEMLDWLDHHWGDMQLDDGSFPFPDHPAPVRTYVSQRIAAAMRKGVRG